MSRLLISGRIPQGWMAVFGLSFVLAVAIEAIVLPLPAHSAQVSVGWNASSSSVTGYKIYYGLSSGNYTFPVIDAGNVLSYTIPEDLTAPRYYITATAYDATAESPIAPELVIYSEMASAGTGGSISPIGSFYAEQGSNQTFTITPDTGYSVAGVTVDGVAVSNPVTSYTFSNVTANHSISATFALNTFTITSSAGVNGSISPSPSARVNYGASQTFSINPKTGYSVAGVTVDGVALSNPVASYTFNNVTANHSISATFAIDTYTITSTAGVNGSISPSPSARVNYGASQTFSINSNPGYIVAGVTVDGIALSTPVTSYTFSNVTSNHSIAAGFSQSNQPPVANAGPTQTVAGGLLVTLNGSNSTDPANSPLSYMWTQTGGTRVSLSNQTAAQPTFTAPSVGTSGAALTFLLTVTDRIGLKSSDTCIVNVTWSNIPPTANAGPDQAVLSAAAVTLDGSSSTDPNDGIASYLWMQIAGPAVTLTPTTRPSRVTFIAPDSGQAGTSLTFRLTVTDRGGLKSTSTCVVNVGVNPPPQANAGQDQSVYGGDVTVLDGSRSSDPASGIKSCLWKQTSGPPVTLTNPTVVKPAFTAPIVNVKGATLTFLLTVTDNGGLQSQAACGVYVKLTPGPDLTGSWQTRSLSGTALSGSFKVTNTGNQAAGTSVTALYRSGDGITLGKFLGLISIDGLKAAQSKIVSFNYSGVSSKYVIAVVDANNSVAESNEQNNQISVVIQ